jgi:hypothetical protein
VVTSPGTLSRSETRPTTPFKPVSFSVTGPRRTSTSTRPKGPKFGAEVIGADGEVVRDNQGRAVREFLGWEQEGKTRVCWDLKIQSDGHRWFARYYSSGQAAAARDLLIAGFAKGLLFDPGSKRFLEPDQESVPEVAPEPTVFSESLAWWITHWTRIEPKSRKETLRYICRPITDFVGKGSKAPVGLDAYLQWQMLPPKGDVPVPPQHEDAATWVRQFSLPVRDVDAAMWQTYVDRWKINTRSGRPLAQSSLTRHLADVRQMWSWVCANNEITDPWPLLKTHIRSSAGGPKGSMVRPVDRTIVLAPNHVRELAEVCGEGSFGRLAEVYVLLLGIAGGRPGESAGVETQDLELTGDDCNVKFRRISRRGIDQSFLDPDDDVIWGPLKGRQIEDSRRVAIPLTDAARIRSALAAEQVTGPLFDGWDRDKFCRDVWDHAKAELAERIAHRADTGDVDRRDADALRSALRRLRLHDLRHSACSMWLNTPGIEVKMACEWSGHKRLGVFLEIYQGLMPGATSSASAKLNAAW